MKTKPKGMSARAFWAGYSSAGHLDSAEMGEDMDRIEWRAWRALCAELQRLGAVTAEDLTSRASLRDTPGQCLLQRIREYADIYRRMTESAGPRSLS